LAEKVHEIVIDLIRDSQVAAEPTCRFDVTIREARQLGAKRAGNPEKFGSLEIDNPLVLRTTDVRGSAAQRLDDLTRANPARRLRNGSTHFSGRKLSRQVKRMRKQSITQENCGSSAILARGGSTTTPHICFIHDVVMDQSGQVDEFDDCRYSNKILPDFVCAAPPAQEYQRRPDAFARGINAVIHHPPNLGFERPQLCM
jgi:hypothetical protein